MAMFLLQEPLDSHFNLGDLDKPTDFSNPMYDVIGGVDKGAPPQLYEAPPAVVQGRKAALDPAPLDTDKDTAQLVVEDKSDC